ncbi:PIN domain-containing protein [Rhizobium sp. 2MFCol3.1]|uniref:PIN domain-containing protein n=1 Tax=Rhizobium sp. 2MFCol3.1 TaxID=1246459 RepID=UPI00036AB33D|nr:PIN domain-containing protein [Rhizobium sp. 2MFCol3.1]
MTDDIYLLDTNVISNSSKQSPLPAVKRWLENQTRLAIPFPVILEVETGIADLRPVDPIRARKLTEWIDGLLKTKFYYPPSSPEVARVLAKLYCCRPLARLWQPQEDKKPGQDLFIAAVSIVYDMPIATMNTGDFEQINKHRSLPGVFNPNRGIWTVPRLRRTLQGDPPAEISSRDDHSRSAVSQDQEQPNDWGALGLLTGW